MLLKPLPWAEVESDQRRGRVRRRASGQGRLPRPLTGPRGRLFVPGPGTSDGAGSTWQRLHSVKTDAWLAVVLAGPCTWLGAGLASGHLEKIQQPTETSQGPKLEKWNHEVDNVVLDRKPKQKANTHAPTRTYVNDGINKYWAAGTNLRAAQTLTPKAGSRPPILRRGRGDRLPEGAVWRGKRGPARWPAR